MEVQSLTDRLVEIVPANTLLSQVESFRRDHAACNFLREKKA